MAPYDRRDLFKHWIERRQRVNQPCTHACCRGRRLHPKGYPVILPNPLLRKASEKDLAEHWTRVEGLHTAAGERARAQLLHEMDRRDQADIKRQEARDAYRARILGKKLERAEAVDMAWLQAEAATKGNMLNKAGRAAGINERSLFAGPESRARRYASEELLNHWQTYHRPTAAYFAGKDIRLGAVYSAPRRKQYGVVSRRTLTGKDGRRLDVAVVRRKAS